MVALLVESSVTRTVWYWRQGAETGDSQEKVPNAVYLLPCETAKSLPSKATQPVQRGNHTCIYQLKKECAETELQDATGLAEEATTELTSFHWVEDTSLEAVAGESQVTLSRCV